MPKASRSRPSLHNQSVKLSARFAQISNHGATERVEIGSMAEASGSQILESFKPEPTVQLKKKTKQHQKHQAFMDRLQASQSPYSRSHARRLRRKEKEQLVTRLDDLNTALEEIDPTQSTEIDLPGITSARRKDLSTVKASLKPGQIGEGKGAPLSKSQRKLALRAERHRMPRIIAAPQFSQNPFEAIRLHAQNTLVPHEVPAAESI